MYALFEIKGKQYKAEKGSKIKVDRIDTAAGEPVEFESVLMISADDDVKLGTPYVDGAKVTAIVEEHDRTKKLTVFKYKKRKNYRRKYGHRQPYTVIRIEDILN